MTEHEKMEALRKTIEASPLTLKIMAEEAAAVLVTRKDAALKIEAIERDRDAPIPSLLADLVASDGNRKSGVRDYLLTPIRDIRGHNRWPLLDIEDLPISYWPLVLFTQRLSIRDYLVLKIFHRTSVVTTNCYYRGKP